MKKLPNHFTKIFAALLLSFCSINVFGQNPIPVSATPNMVAFSNFQFTIKKVKHVPISESKIADFKKQNKNIDGMEGVEIFYEIKNITSTKQAIKGKFDFPTLYTVENGKNVPYYPSYDLSFGGNYLNLKGEQPADYAEVVATAAALDAPYEVGQAKNCRYFMYLMPKSTKNLIFWLQPIDEHGNRSSRDAKGCAIKL